MDSFVTDGSDDFDDPIPDLVQYEDEDGNNIFINNPMICRLGL